MIPLTPFKASALLAAPMLVMALGTAACRQDEPQPPPPTMQSDSPRIGEAAPQRLADNEAEPIAPDAAPAADDTY